MTDSVNNTASSLINFVNPITSAIDSFQNNFNPIVGSANRILFKSRQYTLGESILADIYDDIIGIIPFLGDLISYGNRVQDAIARDDTEAATIQGANFFTGLIPEVGDAIDAFFPANTLLKTHEMFDCAKAGNKPLDCAFPEGSIERNIFSFIKA